MKVQIIYLDPHDDYVSARDKLGWAKAPRVLLVWPSYGQILNRRLDLILLQRFADQHSFQLGLVTRDPAVAEIAGTIALPTFSTLDDVSEQGWRRPARKRPIRLPSEDRKPTRIERPLKPQRALIHTMGWLKIGRPFFFSLALLSVLALAAALIPSADVRLSPVTEEITLQVAFQLDPNIERAQPDGRIPGYTITVRVSDSLRLPTSGRTAIPGTSAQGSVVFTNLTSDRIVVPAGTGLRSTTNANLRFVTSDDVEVPGEEGAQITCPIVADEPGPRGNVPAAAIDAVEGTLGLQLEVSNPEALMGGSNTLRAAVAQADRTRAEAELSRILLEEAAKEMDSTLEPGEVLVGESIHIIEVHQRTFDRDIGEPADSLSLELELEVGALFYRESDLDAGIRSALASAKPDGLQIVTDVYGYEVVEINAPALDQISLKVQAWQHGYEPIDAAELRSMLRALPREEALRLLQENMALQIAPSIRLRPSWLPRLPWLPLRISVTYEWPTLK